ncbi:hypothetical protein JB92DRAFT_2829481 [Gautieria morchelliformis]|nr:hypothetical protein JB92DRAFT_2829481 [Gautieria morchelliformis]
MHITRSQNVNPTQSNTSARMPQFLISPRLRKYDVDLNLERGEGSNPPVEVALPGINFSLGKATTLKHAPSSAHTHQYHAVVPGYREGASLAPEHAETFLENTLHIQLVKGNAFVHISGINHGRQAERRGRQIWIRLAPSAPSIIKQGKRGEVELTGPSVTAVQHNRFGIIAPAPLPGRSSIWPSSQQPS